MISSSVKLTDSRLLLPEIIWLKPEYFERAKQMSDRVKSDLASGKLISVH
jgi:hypothetical protein